MPELPRSGQIPISAYSEQTDEWYARKLVCMWVNARLLREPGEALIPSSFDVISFTKVAGNWKAIMVVPGRSSMYEITYDLEEKSHIISEYHRIRSDRLDAI